jgi:hypothetical protein
MYIERKVRSVRKPVHKPTDAEERVSSPYTSGSCVWLRVRVRVFTVCVQAEGASEAASEAHATVRCYAPRHADRFQRRLRQAWH